MSPSIESRVDWRKEVALSSLLGRLPLPLGVGVEGVVVPAEEPEAEEGEEE